MRVVLIGGAGFIGHNLAIELTKRSHDVTIIDSLMINNYYAVREPRYKKFLEDRLFILAGINVPVIRMDARDYHMLSETISALNPDCVVHLAAVAHMDRSDKTPYTTFDHSLRTLENALDVSVEFALARERPPPKFIYFSSSTVYGDWTSDKAVESQWCKPIGIYGSLKLAGEHMVQAYRQAKGLPYIIIRPSALYGPRCVSGRVIQRFIESALDGKPLTVRGNGKLDFTYVADLVTGVRQAIESNVVDETFNMTYGEGVPVAYVAEKIVSETGAKVVYSNEPDVGPERGTLDISKARELLTYRPKFDIDKGLSEYLTWYRREFEHSPGRTGATAS